MPPSREAKLCDFASSDILIVIMGPTGCGKSTIIDHLTDPKKKRAHSSLKSYTKEIAAVRMKEHPVYGDRIVLIDTPGFDDNERSDMEILDMIAQWLKANYVRPVLLAGIINLHPIQDNLMASTPLRNLTTLEELCGENTWKKVLLGTTMWDVVPRRVAEDRENQLRRDFWDSRLWKGTNFGRSYNDKESARNLINMVLKETDRETLLLEEELVNLEWKLNETSSGKELYSTLIRLLAEQKQTASLLIKQAKDNRDSRLAKQLDQPLKQIQSDLEATFQQIDNMKVPLTRRMTLLFSRKVDGGMLEDRVPLPSSGRDILYISERLELVIMQLEALMSHVQEGCLASCNIDTVNIHGGNFVEVQGNYYHASPRHLPLKRNTV